MSRVIKINGKEITLAEYNNLYFKEQHPVLKRLGELYDEIYGSKGVGSREEYEKSKKVNRQLFADTENAYNKYCESKGQNYWEIWDIDNDDKVKKTIARSEQLLDGAQGIVNDMEQLKSQRDKTGNEYNEKPYQNPNPDQTREERNEKADNLRKWRAEAKSEIETVLNQEPKITTSDLDGENRTYEKNLENAILGEDEVKEIKERVLADILRKREAKNKASGNKGDKRKREDEEDDEQDTPNKKPKVDENELVSLISQAQNTNKFEDLKTLLEKINAFEGEPIYQENQSVINSLKLKTAIINKLEYKNGVVNNLKTRLDKIKDKIGDKNGTIVGKLEELKNSTDMDDINRIENEITAEIGQSEANITLDKMIDELKEIWQGVIDKKINRSKVRTQLDKIKTFQESTNSYKQSAYQAKSVELNSLMTKIDNSLQTNQEGNGIAPWKIIVPVVGVVVLLAVGLIVYRRKNKIKNKI